MLGPSVVCYAGSRIGDRVVLKAGAVIGGDGFGYLSDGTGHHRIPHLGGCVLDDDVEVGSNTCIDRGSIDDTVIGRGTKLDNLVQVGHNVQIGERCLIMAGVGIAGSTRIGNDVILAGHVGVTDHLIIGDRARIAAKSAIFGDVPPGASFSGHPADRTGSFSGPRRRCTGSRPSWTSWSGWRPNRLPCLDALLRTTPASAESGCTPASYVSAVCRAGPAGQGIVFRRTDLPDRPSIPARLSMVQSTERRTALGEGETIVQTVEHLLAAAAALQLDDLTIELDGPEPPIGDGSFSLYLKALADAGNRGTAGRSRGIPGPHRL